jgi:hypothetical protein
VSQLASDPEVAGALAVAVDAGVPAAWIDDVLAEAAGEPADGMGPLLLTARLLSLVREAEQGTTTAHG